MRRLLAGSLLLVLMVSACGGQGLPPPGEREYGHGSQWIDEPLPTLDQLMAAESCEEFMRMLVGVENERFRLKEDVTAADDLANNYTLWDFDDLDVAADPPEGLDCRDADFMTVFENSFLARCDRWFGDGHSPNENPLMLNTEQCLN